MPAPRDDAKKQNIYTFLKFVAFFKIMSAFVCFGCVSHSKVDIRPTCVCGEGSEETIEQTELIFITGMGSCSSLQWDFTLLAMSAPGQNFLSAVWRLGSVKERTRVCLSSDNYSCSKNANTF